MTKFFIGCWICAFISYLIGYFLGRSNYRQKDKTGKKKHFVTFQKVKTSWFLIPTIEIDRHHGITDVFVWFLCFAIVFSKYNIKETDYDLNDIPFT